MTMFPFDAYRLNTSSGLLSKMAVLWGRPVTVPSMRHSILAGFFRGERLMPRSCHSSLSMKSICSSSSASGSKNRETAVSPVESDWIFFPVSTPSVRVRAYFRSPFELCKCVSGDRENRPPGRQHTVRSRRVASGVHTMRSRTRLFVERLWVISGCSRVRPRLQAVASKHSNRSRQVFFMGFVSRGFFSLSRKSKEKVTVSPLYFLRWFGVFVISRLFAMREDSPSSGE